MHPSAERALDLISTTRSPAQLLKASQGAWNEHGYPLTYACFMALVAFTDNFGEQTDGDLSTEVTVPRPRSEVILLAGRRRGEECLDMLNDLFTRVRTAAQRQTQELASGPSLEDLDKNYKGNAVYLMASIVGSGVETLEEQGEDADRVLESVAQFLEQLSS